MYVWVCVCVCVYPHVCVCIKRISSKYNVICVTFKYPHTNTSERYGYSCLRSLSLIRSVYVHVFMNACMNATMCVCACAECMYMHRWRDGLNRRRAGCRF